MPLIAMDSRKRVSLSKLIPNSTAVFFDASVNKDGDVVLKPMVAIPEKERWVFEKPGLVEQIREGISDAKAGRTVPYSKIR